MSAHENAASFTPSVWTTMVRFCLWGSGLLAKPKQKTGVDANRRWLQERAAVEHTVATVPDQKHQLERRASEMLSAGDGRNTGANDRQWMNDADECLSALQCKLWMRTWNRPCWTQPRHAELAIQVVTLSAPSEPCSRPLRDFTVGY